MSLSYSNNGQELDGEIHVDFKSGKVECFLSGDGVYEYENKANKHLNEIYDEIESGLFDCTQYTISSCGNKGKVPKRQKIVDVLNKSFKDINFE